MTEDEARKDFDNFSEETAKRIDSVIYRMKHTYNFSKKINNIKNQSNFSRRNFNERLAKIGFITPEESVQRNLKETKSNCMDTLQQEMSQIVQESLNNEKFSSRNAYKSKSHQNPAQPYINLKTALKNTLLGA